MATELPDPLTHAVQAEVAIAPHSRVKADAVIGDLNHQGVGRLARITYANVNMLRPGVLDGVVQRLLDDTEQLLLGPVAEGQAFLRGINVDLLFILAGQSGSVAAHGAGDRAMARSLLRRLQSLPSGNPDDPGYRRLRYCRYADDTLLGFAGPKDRSRTDNDAPPQ